MPEEGTPFLRDRPRRVRPGALVVAAASLALLSARAARRPAAARAARAAALWADDGGVLGDWRAADDDAANATSRRAGKDRDNCKVFKRTLATPDAFGDGAWLRENLGFAIGLNRSYDAGGATCAHRVLLTALDGWSVHLFESAVTPQGNATVADFSADWASLHARLGSSSYERDAWLMQSQTFYAPTLTPFLERWRERGVGFVGARYASPSDNVTLYSAMVSLPHAGHVIEVRENVRSPRGTFPL